MAVSFIRINFFSKTAFNKKRLTLKTDSAASVGTKGGQLMSFASLSLRLRQDCRFQSYVSYFLDAYGPLIAARNYPTSSIIKCNFFMFIQIKML